MELLELRTSVLYLAEQHGKGPCDRLFGWTRKWINTYIQTKDIFNLQNLAACYTEGAATMQREDPNGPIILVHTFDPGKDRPSKRRSLQCPSLKISRTYSLSAEPNQYASQGVSIFNNVFTDTPTRTSLSNWSIEESISQEAIPWRRGYYDKPRSWEKMGPSPGDINEVTRRFADQQAFLAEEMPAPKRSVEQKLSAKAQSLSHAAAKWRRQKHAAGEDSSSDSESCTSSSSTSSEQIS